MLLIAPKNHSHCLFAALCPPLYLLFFPLPTLRQQTLAAIGSQQQQTKLLGLATLLVNRTGWQRWTKQRVRGNRKRQTSELPLDKLFLLLAQQPGSRQGKSPLVILHMAYLETVHRTSNPIPDTCANQIPRHSFPYLCPILH